MFAMQDTKRILRQQNALQSFGACVITVATIKNGVTQWILCIKKWKERGNSASVLSR